MNEAVWKEFGRQRRREAGLGQKPAKPVGAEKRERGRERKEKLGHMSGKGSIKSGTENVDE